MTEHQRTMTEQQRCIAYFKEIGHEAHEYRGAVYLYVGDGLEVELSTEEVSFRADEYINRQLENA